MPADVLERAAVASGVAWTSDLKAVLAGRLGAFIDRERYFAASQTLLEIGTQLEAVADAAAAFDAVAAVVDALDAALDALGPDAEARYRDRLPRSVELAMPDVRAAAAAVQAVLPTVRAIAASARDAVPDLSDQPRPGPMGNPVAERLVHEFAWLLWRAGGEVVERNHGPVVDFFTVLYEALPDELRTPVPKSGLGDTIKGILQKASKQ